MDELIFRSLMGDTSSVEERKLEAWRHASPENEGRYREIVRLWELRGVLRARLHAVRAPEAEEVLSRSKPGRTPGSSRRSGPRETSDSSGTRRPRLVRRVMQSGWIPPAAAAAITLLFAAGIWMLETRRGADAPASHRTGVQVVTAVGEQSTVRLEDGTRVRLGARTSLRAPPWTAEARELWVSGRAYFAVVPDENRPLRIQTPGGEVVVKGTRFDLQARARDLQIVVVDGLVEVASEDGPVALGPNQMARVRDRKEPEVIHVDNVHDYLQWMGDFVAFESTPLSTVAREIEERFGLRVEIQDEALASKTVTSWSDDKSAREILTAICWAVDARCVFVDGEALIQP